MIIFSFPTTQIDFRDTNLESFRAVLEYLYTGVCTDIPDMHGTLQLANFLCLRHLVAVCEDRIAKRVSQIKLDEHPDLYDYVIGKMIQRNLYEADTISPSYRDVRFIETLFFIRF